MTANKLIGDKKIPFIGIVLVGVLGTILGCYIFPCFGWFKPTSMFELLLASTAGAIILLAAFKIYKKMR